MTISSSVRKAGPFIGSGAASSFPFSFKVFAASDLLVVKLNSSTSIETTLALTTDYTVSLNADQNVSPGGTITLVAGALASGYTLTITSSIDALQQTDLTNQGGFYPSVITNALDKLTILTQQNIEELGRSLTLPISTPGSVSTELPPPGANQVLAWNATGTALQNTDAATLASNVVATSWNSKTFSGTGAQTAFVLPSSGGVAAAVQVELSGVRQTPGDDYTLSSDGLTITFTSAPPAGTNNVLAVWGTALPSISNQTIIGDLSVTGGAAVSGTLGVTGNSTLAGNLTLSGAGARITGDFSNATVANRVMFQTSTTNGNTTVSAIPNGTGTASGIGLYSKADTANSELLTMYSASGSAVVINSDKTGTGTYLPMTFYTGGAERVRIDTSGNVGIGGAPSAWTTVKCVQGDNVSFAGKTALSSVSGLYYDTVWKYAANGYGCVYGSNNTSGIHSFYVSPSGVSGNAATLTESFRIDASGNALVVNPSGGLGYGTGTGGTVTQATSKSTAVTLNKPTGRIQTASDSLGAGGTVAFNFNNTLIGANDQVLLTKVSGSGTDAAYNWWVNTFGSGGVAAIYIKNITAGALSESLVFNFAIIKGATA